MNRHFGWAVLLAVGMALGWALSTYERTHAAPSTDVDIAQDDSAKMVEQLKEINAHLKKIDTLLHSGRLMVVNAINADIAQ